MCCGRSYLCTLGFSMFINLGKKLSSSINRFTVLLVVTFIVLPVLMFSILPVPTFTVLHQCWHTHYYQYCVKTQTLVHPTNALYWTCQSFYFTSYCERIHMWIGEAVRVHQAVVKMPKAKRAKIKLYNTAKDAPKKPTSWQWTGKSALGVCKIGDPVLQNWSQFLFEEPFRHWNPFKSTTKCCTHPYSLVWVLHKSMQD